MTTPSFFYLLIFYVLHLLIFFRCFLFFYLPINLITCLFILVNVYLQSMDSITLPEAANLVGCSRPTIRSWMLEDKFKYSIKFIGIRKYYMIDKKTFLEFWKKKKKEIGK